MIPAEYARQHVELAYATTVHGAQGETVDHAHLVWGDHTAAASAYVAMTRGRRSNTAHIVADSLEFARAHWVDVFNRDCVDLGPAHAAIRAAGDIDRYGSRADIHPQGSIAVPKTALRHSHHLEDQRSGRGTPRRPELAPTQKTAAPGR
jgi:hypothetical protein